MKLTDLELTEVTKTELDRLWDSLNSGCQSDDFLNSLDITDFEKEYLAWWEVNHKESKHDTTSGIHHKG